MAGRPPTVTARLRAGRPPATTRAVVGGLLRVVRADRRTVWRWAVALLVAAAVVRVGWAAWIAHAEPAGVRTPDTPGYVQPARALIEAGRFSLSPSDSTPMYVRTPGYPVFLAPILWLTDSEWAISPTQASVSLLAIAATVLIGWRLCGKTAGLLAGAVVAVDPLQFVAAGTIMTEAVTTVVLVAIVAIGAVVFALRSPPDVPLVALFALGALVAAATVLRPTFWFYPAVLVALLAFRFRRLPGRSLVSGLLVFLLPIVLVVGGWQLRNHSAVGSWDVSGIADINLYCFNAAEVEANVAGISRDAAKRRLGCPTTYPNPNEICTPSVGYGCWMPDPDADGQGFDEWGGRGLDIMLDHPLQSARALGGGIVRELAGPGRAQVAHYLGIDTSMPLAIGLSSWVVVLWVPAAVGAVAGLRSRYRAFWAFVIATIGYVILISAGTAGDARFRAPLVPLIALLAAHGIRQSARTIHRRQVPPVGEREPRGEPERQALSPAAPAG
jgi:4-amino-4-deoxy-L-arabinose transferase-like glycosyltransferase